MDKNVSFQCLYFVTNHLLFLSMINDRKNCHIVVRIFGITYLVRGELYNRKSIGIYHVLKFLYLLNCLMFV